jgi:predicted small lipoprotein YifL
LARFAVLGALMAALVLAACGRKGPLDPPPIAAAPPAQGAAPAAQAVAPQSEAPASQSAASAAGKTTGLKTQTASKGPQVFNRHGQPVAPPGPKVHLPIDWLID